MVQQLSNCCPMGVLLNFESSYASSANYSHMCNGTIAMLARLASILKSSSDRQTN